MSKCRARLDFIHQEWIGLWKVGVTYQNIARRKHKFVHYRGQTDGTHF